MSRPIPTGGPGSDLLERGRFSDGRTRFNVRASSVDAPESFQVYVEGNRADIVLIVSGLGTEHLHATWGEGWRSCQKAWKTWAEKAAFQVFYNGHHRGGPDAPGVVRVCNG
ncbi:hypothetical protein [Glycomyces buryatensis]|uniref:Uncharacterized protein n=1 Tax=Glycomyces buryatensis TaxID=2570927 RepID=A0A4S8QFT5_9ACTN|nr:hypothetical protein [Glycomyces buryatensis]THV42551.1 hypothetical protein FAB82_05090 [Glycomyces buryatensis]